MKKYMILPMEAVVGGAFALLLRLKHMETGFEAGTGLPILGNPYRLALMVWLLFMAVTLFLISRRTLSGTAAESFPAAFSTTEPLLLMLPIAGVFLLVLSGLLELYTGYRSGPLAALPGALSVLSGIALLPAAAACKGRSGESGSCQPALLLVPVACMVVRLILVYRVVSVNPVLSAYYVELLALVFVVLGFYKLSAFGVRSGRSDRFALYAGIAVVLCLATLGDRHPLAQTAFYLGCGCTLLGFLLLHVTQQEASR